MENSMFKRLFALHICKYSAICGCFSNYLATSKN